MLIEAQEVTKVASTGFVIVTGVFTAAAAVSAFLIARSMYKSGMPDRKAQLWRENYEAEKVNREHWEKNAKELAEAKKTWDNERASLVSDYSQLSQLFAKKSLLLEALTGYYGSISEAMESGNFQEFVKATQEPVKVRRLDSSGEHHRTES